MRLEQYSDDTNITLGDKVIGSDADESGKTKEYSFSAIKAFLIAEGLGVVVKTAGTITADNVSLYQVLSYDLNTVDTTGASDKVVLPTTAVIGKEVLVFASNNANAFTVRGNQAGGILLSPNGVGSQSTSVSIAPNISYRFIHLGSGYWKAEII